MSEPSLASRFLDQATSSQKVYRIFQPLLLQPEVQLHPEPKMKVTPQLALTNPTLFGQRSYFILGPPRPFRPI